MWAEAMYPGLTTNIGKTTFYAYDIDNPGAKAVWNLTLDAMVPVVVSEAGGSASIGWSLANEPGLVAANSTYTLDKWAVYLKGAYNGSLVDFGSGWNLTSVPTSWDDAVVANGMGWTT
jgi:hypothetical protein